MRALGMTGCVAGSALGCALACARPINSAWEICLCCGVYWEVAYHLTFYEQTNTEK